MIAAAIPNATRTRPSASERYTDLLRYRPDDEADICAGLTLPYLKPDCASWMKKTKVGNQTVGCPRGIMNAHAVSTLASKLSGVLLPHTNGAFRLEVAANARITAPDPSGEGTVELELGEREQRELEQYLTRVTRWIYTEIGHRALRQVLEEAERSAIVCSMGLIHMPRGQKARGFRFDQFVINTDGFGNLLELIVRQRLGFKALPDVVRSTLIQKNQGSPEKLQALESQDFDFFTVVERTPGEEENGVANFIEYQECLDEMVPGTLTEYGPKRKLRRIPWILVPWRRIADSMYPTSLVSERKSIHAQHEGLSAALQLIAIMASDRKRVVKPGFNDPDEFNESPAGSTIQGDPAPSAMGVTGLGDVGDVQWLTQLNAITMSFLQRVYGVYDTSSVEPVERRTGIEASMIARELNAANQGVYSLHVELVQIPIIELLLDEALNEEALLGTALKKLRSAINPRVIGGLDALGRDDEAGGWAKFYGLVRAAQESGFSARSNESILYREMAAVCGVNLGGIALNEDELMQRAQADVMTPIAQEAATAYAKAAAQNQQTVQGA